MTFSRRSKKPFPHFMPSNAPGIFEGHTCGMPVDDKSTLCGADPIFYNPTIGYRCDPHIPPGTFDMGSMTPLPPPRQLSETEIRELAMAWEVARRMPG